MKTQMGLESTGCCVCVLGGGGLCKVEASEFSRRLARVQFPRIP